MNHLSIIMPVIAALGTIFLIAILLIMKGIEKKEKVKGVDITNFNRFIEEIKQENAEMKKDLQLIKEKVKAIDDMMKDI